MRSFILFVDNALACNSKSLQLSLFSSLFFLYSKSGRNDQSCLSNFLQTSITLYELVFIPTHWWNVKWEIFIEIWNFVCENMTCHVLRENNSEHTNVINTSHDVNSILYAVTNIHWKAVILLKLINVSRSKNLALFTVIIIHSILNTWKNRRSEKGWKAAEVSRLYKVQTGRKTGESSW